MQAMSCFVGGLPMLFYGDEVGYTNDYSYLDNAGKNYDNRWMHRPLINWKKNDLLKKKGTTENRIFTATKRLLEIRKSLPALADFSNVVWMPAHNISVAGFIRQHGGQRIFCLFNFSPQAAQLTWFAFTQQGTMSERLHDHYSNEKYVVGSDNEFLEIGAYAFLILEECR